MRCDPRVERDARRPVIAPDLVLALDQGTTSSRAALVDATGRRIAEQQVAHRQHHPRPGLVEHDPVELLDAIALDVPVASSPKSRSSASRASESRTSARRSCSGIEPRACPSPTRSSGRTLARPIAAAHSSRPERRRSFVRARVCRFSPTSRRRSSAGCSTLSPGPASGPNEASSPPARSNAGSPGGCPEPAGGAQSRTSRTRLARSSSTPRRSSGTTSCSTCSRCRARSSPRSCRPGAPQGLDDHVRGRPPGRRAAGARA